MINSWERPASALCLRGFAFAPWDASEVRTGRRLPGASFWIGGLCCGWWKPSKTRGEAINWQRLRIGERIIFQGP